MFDKVSPVFANKQTNYPTTNKTAIIQNEQDVLTLARDMADRRFSPDIATAFGSCLNANASGGDTVKPTIANTTAARLVKEEEKRCPDALLVRAIEALGRVYMHREAALLVGEDSGAGSRGGN